MLKKLTLTSEEIRAGFRRAADVPRLKYLVRAMDGRGEGANGFVTAAVIKRAMGMAAKDGAKIDPMTGYLLEEAPPKKKGKKAPPKKPAQDALRATESPPLEATGDVPNEVPPDTGA